MAERFCDNPDCELHEVEAHREALREAAAESESRRRRMLYKKHATGPERHYCEECYKALLAGGLTPD